MWKDLLYKTSDKNYKEKYNRFLLLCEKYNAKIIKFDYYKKVFGNFVIEIAYNDTLQTIITDRGEIVFNGNHICDNSYLITGQDTFTKLLELVEKEMFSK